MHLRFMSICDLLLFLLSVSSIVIFYTFTPSNSFANTNLSVNGEGMSYWDDRTSKKDACDIAELEAKNDVLRQLGLERLKSNQVEACLDSGDKVNCELYQSTFNTISGGYIKNFEIIEQKRGGTDNNFCVVKIIADVVKFKGKHDPDFIINADLGLYLPDFRAEEKIFQLIYQASGRSGRGEKKGEVIIQTFSSDNSTIKNAAKQNIKKFYLSMLKEREELFYPPYSWLAKIEISGNKSSRVLNSANEIFNLRGDSYKGLHVLGPNPCYIEKLKGQYRWQIIFKSEKTIDPNGIKLHQYIQRIIHRCQEELNYKGNNVNIHIDPLSLV